MNAGTGVFWREKGTKAWRTGWIITRICNRVQIGAYAAANEGVWYDLMDIDIETRS